MAANTHISEAILSEVITKSVFQSLPPFSLIGAFSKYLKVVLIEFALGSHVLWKRTLLLKEITERGYNGRGDPPSRSPSKEFLFCWDADMSESSAVSHLQG